MFVLMPISQAILMFIVDQKKLNFPIEFQNLILIYIFVC